MKREILFRGKRVDDGRWVYGYYSGPVGIDPSHEICDINDLTGSRFDVDLDTVGQYTGLTDKRGKRIFEGDILKGDEYPYKSPEGLDNYYAEIVWFDDSPAFGLYTFKNPQSKVAGISGGLADYMEEFVPAMWEIIGNVYDNPELMEEKP